MDILKINTLSRVIVVWIRPWLMTITIIVRAKRYLCWVPGGIFDLGPKREPRNRNSSYTRFTYLRGYARDYCSSVERSSVQILLYIRIIYYCVKRYRHSPHGWSYRIPCGSDAVSSTILITGSRTRLPNSSCV